jgi:Nucleotidyltransferase of unknown function (DUF6036)
MFTDRQGMRTAFQAVGELLSADGETLSILVVGGAGLNLLGVIERATSDVDVIARVKRDANGTPQITNANPFPQALIRAISTVARDLQLPGNWMNHEVAMQWTFGMPPDILADVTWESYSGLSVGLVGRQTQITLKLFAAVDRGVKSVHIQDLLALRPSLDELANAKAWVLTQDAGPDFPASVTETIDYVTRHAR